MEKKYWFCAICGDLHVGANPPDSCPTYHQGKEKYVEISFEDFQIEIAKFKK
ncbi:MAG: hypothetical protein Q7J14_00555 [Candidatus Magasanikbacteria bacterium]|nr:hypothetical protein [Candidatus Magasanikbacteria bacterium]